MKPAPLPDTIDVDRLCIGMVIQLDGGWMSHPFPLSRFRITSAEQIATIRALGVAQVRCIAPANDAFESAGSAAVPDEDAVEDAEVDPSPGPAAARAAPRQQLAVQRAALRRCGRQFEEAARELRHITDSVLMRPVAAREQAEALIRTLADKIIGQHDLCIRLLTDTAGDKASKHALNVTVISMLMGRRLGLSDAEMHDLGAGAMLHDIGKLELPARARHREDQASSAESRHYEEHVARGLAVARRMGLSPGAALIVAQHHENADGSGFPMRLNVDGMTVGARIVALVNRYDNLCNPRQPARALTPHEALSLLFTQGQNKFETTILGAFIRMMGVYPAGSTVQLTDDRYALVVGVNSSRPLKPQVRVHDDRVHADDALILDLGTVPGLGIRRSLRRQQLPAPALASLAPRAEVAYFFEPVTEVAHAA